MMGELSFLLGLQVKQQYKGIFINQSKYITDMLMKFSFSDWKPAKTPMSSTLEVLTNPSGNEVNLALYKGIIGFLLYPTTSRPAIMFTTNMCSRFQVNPYKPHLLIVK